MQGKFGKFIETNRKLKNLSLRSTAKILNISVSYLSDLEKGNRNPPKLKLINCIAEIYNLSMVEYAHMCNLIAEEMQDIPVDILHKLYSTVYTESDRLLIWEELRKKKLEKEDEVKKDEE